VFSASALVTHGHAAEYAEYYIYKDPHGRLVISNKLPPEGSSNLKKHHLREPAEGVPQPPEAADPQPNGRSETSRQPQKKEITAPGPVAGSSLMSILYSLDEALLAF
jgi:hypothetical protein